MVLAEKTAALRALHQVLPPGQIITDPVALLTYGGDAGLDRGIPDGVVFPHTIEDMVHIVQWCNTHNIPLIARGAGTGLSGGAVPEHGGIIVEFARMQDIRAFDEREGSIIAQSGVITMYLDTLVKTRGWYYPPDPSSGRASTLGGNIAENSGGPHCFKYGVTANYITSLDVVLADGRAVRFGGRASDYPAFDLAGLMTGSEGTLGLITAAGLRLIRQPPAVKTLISAFESVEAAGAAVSDVIAQGLTPATMEMMDQSFLRIIEEFTPAGLPTDAGAALIIEVDGYPQSVEPQIAEIVAILEAHETRNLRIAQTDDERARIWYGRKSAAGAIARLAPAFYLVDGTVPRSKLAAALAATSRICADMHLRVVYVFHAGDGNLHPLILIEDTKDQVLIQRVIEAGHRIVEMCVSYGGSITGEHGVGIEKRALMPVMYNPAELQAMRDIKQVFDPRHLLNPHKIFSPDIPTPDPLPSPAQPPQSSIAPESAQEAAAALRACAAAKQQVRIAGGGTKSHGLPATDVLLSTRSLRGIQTYARDDLYMVVGAGTPLSEIQTALAADAMWVPIVSPWPESTIGGIVATNFNAPLRGRYGGIRDHVLAATVALPNGHVIRAGRPVVKNVAGYDLPKLFVGSHGTLGLLADITLKLTPLPRTRTSLVVPIAGETALSQALTWGLELRSRSIVASALLLCQGQMLTSVFPQAAAAPYALIYTMEGLPEDIAAERDEVHSLLQTSGVTDLYTVEELAGSDIWASFVRGEPAADAATLIRMGVAPGSLPEIMPDIMSTVTGSPFLIDIASGLFYIQAHTNIPACLTHLRQAAQTADGYACTPLHAGSSDFDPWGYQTASLEFMQKIKASWDAEGILNPGAFLL